MVFISQKGKASIGCNPFCGILHACMFSYISDVDFCLFLFVFCPQCVLEGERVCVCVCMCVYVSVYMCV